MANPPDRVSREFPAEFGNYPRRPEQPGESSDRFRDPYAEEWQRTVRIPEVGGFAGRGPKNYQRSDERIHEEACERLTRDAAIDASEIQVDVKDGEITLSGTVPDRRMKHLAEDCVETVSGISDVTNQLRVRRGDESRRADESSHGPSQGRVGSRYA